MASLIVQTAFIGDVVLTTPMIRVLAARGPVDVVTTPAGAGALSGNPHIRRLVGYDKRGTDAGFGGFLRLTVSIRATRDDVAFLAQGSVRSALLARAAHYRERVGFDQSAGSWLYTRRVPYLSAAHHSARLLSLTCDLGAAPFINLRPELFPSAADVAAVDGLLNGAAYSNEPLVALAPGSVWGTKRWPHYVALAQALAATARIAVVGGADDGALAAEIRAAVGPSVIDATGRLSLLASADLIGRCVVLVTNDSAPQHLASAMNTPTVAIFGPTTPAFGFGPLAEHSEIAQLDGLDCRPCHRHGPATCPRSHFRCMRDLSVAHVQQAIAAVSGAQ